MKSVERRVASRLLITFLLVGVVLLLLHIGLKYISVVGYQEKHQAIFEVSNRFDMNNESSVPQWFTHLGFISMAALSWLAAHLSKDRTTRFFWRTVAVLALLLSIDDIATLHETALQVLHMRIFEENPATFLHNAWLLILPFVLVIAGWLFWMAVRVLPRRTTILLVTGGVIYLCGAILMDSVINTLPPRSFAEQGVAAGIEGWLQLIGQTVLVYAVADYLEKQHQTVISQTFNTLKV